MAAEDTELEGEVNTGVWTQIQDFNNRFCSFHVMGNVVQNC